MPLRTTSPGQSLLRCIADYRYRQCGRISLTRYLSVDAAKPELTPQALDTKAFSKTLLLPKTSFPQWSDPEKSEAPFRQRTGEGLYRWQWENAKGPLFVFHDGPPYANGDLHMGHALNKILKDIINRFHVSLGRKVHYIPGWDCHGLPIENKALQELRESAFTAPATTIRRAAHATAMREIASQKEQFRQFGIMADWSDKSTYRTLDHGYEMRQLRVFQKMVEKGLIYRHYRPVHYSPSSHSALAEAELVYKDDHVSHSVYVTFKLDPKQEGFHNVDLKRVLEGQDVQLLVWTTTPWTLTSNMAISVHPDLTYAVVRQDTAGPITIIAKDRLDAVFKDLDVEIIAEFPGQELTGLSYRPIFSSLLTNAPQSLKIIPSPHVTSDSGSGLVHCAPAHGAEDYNVFKSLGLLSTSQSPSTQPIVCHVDAAGVFSSQVAEVVGEEAGGKLVGKEVLGDGSRAVVDLVEGFGSLWKRVRIKHRYPYDWKTDKPIIVTATSQWFANLDDIKDNALKALVDVEFYPFASRNRLESFIRSRSEWCISRQRVWGVPIPALYHTPTDAAVLDSASLNHILAVLQEKGVAHWWDGPVEDFISPALLEKYPLGGDQNVGDVWKKGTDTMDVWFDSGSSWSMLPEMGVGNTRDADGGRKYHADVCLEGSDQHRGWFQSQLLTAISSADAGSEPASPYGALITHGMVLDEKGKKMSKSLGNIVSPLTVVNGGKDKKKNPVYGADTLRLWAATVEYTGDMAMGPNVLSQVAQSMRKIRNSARFILGNIEDVDIRAQMKKVERADMALAERYVMHELYSLEQVALDGYRTYNFPKVMNALITFTNTTLSSLYFDITKDCLYADDVHSQERRAVMTVFAQILETMTSVVAPVLPHLAEEIHQSLHGLDTSVFRNTWTPLGPEWEDPRAMEEMSELLVIRGTALSLLEKARGQKQVRSSLEAEVDIIVPGDIEGSPNMLQLLHREEDFLKTLFIVSNATVVDEGSLGTTSSDWSYIDSVSINRIELVVRVRPAIQKKCPRCWTFTRPESDTLCGRCSSVIKI